MDIKQEKTILDNAIKLLRKGKYEITGDEALVLHQCMVYLIEKIKSLDTKPLPQPVVEEKPKKKQSTVKIEG